MTGKLRLNKPKRANHLTRLVLMSEIRVRISGKIGLDLMMKSNRELRNREHPGNQAINFNAAIATTMTNTKRKNTEYFDIV